MTAQAGLTERVRVTPPTPTRHRPSIARSRVLAAPGSAGPDDAVERPQARPLGRDHRSLPPDMTDLVRDGVSPRDLKAQGGQAVWRALVRTAASAHQRGWDRWEWEAFVCEARSRLGTQARLKDGKRERTDKALSDYLAAAWDQATTWVSEQDAAWTPDDLAEQARVRATAVLAMCADPGADLTDAERAVLAYAATQARTRGWDRVQMARRNVEEATGVGERSVRTALRRLEDRGLLSLDVRGRSGRPGRVTQDGRPMARANLYRLPAADSAALVPYQDRGTRSVGLPALVCGTPPQTDVVDPRPVCGTPPVATGLPADASANDANTTTPPKEGTSMVSLTVTGTPEALAAALDAALDALSRHGVSAEAAAAAPDETDDLPENVVPLRTVNGGAR